MGSLGLLPFCVFPKICTAVGVHCSQAKHCMIRASAEGSFTMKEATLHKNVAQKKNRHPAFSQGSPSSQNVDPRLVQNLSLAREIPFKDLLKPLLKGTCFLEVCFSPCEEASPHEGAHLLKYYDSRYIMYIGGERYKINFQTIFSFIFRILDRLF